MSRQFFQQAQQLATAGRLPDAERACREALRANPSDMQAARLLGQITRQTGKAEESARIFRQLRAQRPNDLQLVGELGASLTAANMHSLALPLLEQAVKTMPSSVTWRIWLGKCLLKLFNATASIKVLEQAREMAPEDPEVIYHLSNALLTAARPAHAEPLIREYLSKHPNSVPARITLANVLEHQARLGEAVAVLKDLLEADPQCAPAIGGLARILRAEGKYEEALAILEPMLAKEPRPDMALAIAPIYISGKRHEQAKQIIERALRSENVPDPVRASLTFGLAQAYDGLKDYDTAFRAFKRANDLFPKSFRRETRLRMYKELRDAFSPEILRDGPRSRIDAGRCIFVVGMPRSGTSLVEQVLDSHPRVFGAGELTELPTTMVRVAEMVGGPVPSCLVGVTQEQLDAGARRYLEALERLSGSADRVVDKLPHNYELIGLIDRMLPGARIIHCRRNPIDNCLSCFVTQLSAWHSYSNDLSNLGWAYGQYERLMAYWREHVRTPILDVQYESMTEDLETQARRIVEFVGLEWDERCLKFYETKRSVTTASVDQVRQPIYKTSVARWKRYGAHLTPLIESLRTAGVVLDDA